MGMDGGSFPPTHTRSRFSTKTNTKNTAGDAVLAEVDAFRAAAGGVDAGSLRRLRELVAPTV
jgi:hypothetical protein